MVFRHLVSYRFNGHMREHSFELPEQVLTENMAALHLLQLHFGDSESGLTMPNAAAPLEEVLAQACLLGITDIRSIPAN